MSNRDDHLVLQGHVPQGTKLVPKLLTLGTQFHAVPYVRIMIPELLWLALLDSHLGREQGARFVETVASAIKHSGTVVWFPAVSCFGQLSEEHRTAVVTALEANGLKAEVSAALAPFVKQYPEFPGAFLVGGEPNRDQPTFLPDYKRLLDQLYDTESGATVFMCANAIYATFCLDLLRVNPTTSLARFPEIQHYPATDISKTIAGACRALSLQMVGEHVVAAQNTSWSSYFWNQGLHIEPLDWSEMEG